VPEDGLSHSSVIDDWQSKGKVGKTMDNEERIVGSGQIRESAGSGAWVWTYLLFG
jgi:hypothetical protein